MSRGALFNESTVVGGYVSVMGILLQHIDLQFNFLLFILDTEMNTHTQTHFREVEKMDNLFGNIIQSLCGHQTLIVIWP